MNNIQLTEADVIEALMADAKTLGVKAPRCRVLKRTMRPNSLTRLVMFALIVPTDNESLIDALITQALEQDNDYIFIGSEVNLQKDSIEVDYLFFEAKIMSKTK